MLVKEFGEEVIEEYIRRTGEYHCCNAETIRKWILEDRKKGAQRKKEKKENAFTTFPQRQYETEQYADMEKRLLKNGGAQHDGE